MAADDLGDLIPRLGQNRNLEPKRSPENIAIRFVADLNGKLPPGCARKRIMRQIGHSARRLIPRRFDAIKFKADFIPKQRRTVARVEKIKRHRGR
jgi:hypothetical protein